MTTEEKQQNPGTEKPETSESTEAEKKSEKKESAKIELNDLKAEAKPKSKHIKALEDEIAEQKNRYLRLAAEYDNYRKRTAKERDNIFSDAYISAINSLLPIYDNVERAAAQPCTDVEYKKGIDLILKQIKDIFNKLEIEEVPGVGEKFEPQYHNAVMHIEDDSLDENVIVEVMQKGFMLKGRIIRHAMVKTAN